MTAGPEQHSPVGRHPAPVGSDPAWYPTADLPAAAGRITEAFRAEYGRAPDGLWAAPGRVNLIGEHVDYQAGLCLPFALPQRTVVAVGVRDDAELHVRSLQQSGADGRWSGRLDDVGPGRVHGWAAYVGGVFWALQQDGLPVTGVDAVVDGSVPLGAGLSSSAALECAVVLALDELVGPGLAADDAGRARLAAACVQAENLVAGAPTGGMDQAAALRALPGHALLLDCRDFTITQVPFDLAATGLELLVIDTRAHHALVDGQYGSRRDTCAQACEVLGVPTLREVPPHDLPAALDRLAADPVAVRRVRHVVQEIDRVRQVAELLNRGLVREIGPLLDASHHSLRTDFEVSCDELDVACETARRAGALGARMVGGGFGGSAIALASSDDVPGIARAVTEAFRAQGWTPPVFLRATAAGPGGRIG